MKALRRVAFSFSLLIMSSVAFSGIAVTDNQSELTDWNGPLVAELPWQEVGPEALVWTSALTKAIESSALPVLVPKGIEEYCPSYSRMEAKKRVKVWAHFFSQLAKYESQWQPFARFEVDGVLGRGLLQIPETMADHCKLKDNIDLHNSKQNIPCAVNIMVSVVSEDMSLSGFEDHQWIGAAKVWESLRSMPDKKPNAAHSEIKDHLKKLILCQK